MKMCKVVGGLLLVAVLAVGAQAAFLVQVDTDGLDDGVLTYSPNFSFAGDTTTASQSVASTAYGLTGGDSIFGGNGAAEPDTYVFTYTPSVDADNLFPTAGQDLGAGNLASGLAGGGAGTYRVYAAWPFSENISGGPTAYTVATAGAEFTVNIDQNGKGDAWILLGDIVVSDPGASITVTQQPTGGNTYVSMRAAGVMFEAIPEPTTMLLLGVGAVLLRRRR